MAKVGAVQKQEIKINFEGQYTIMNTAGFC